MFFLGLWSALRTGLSMDDRFTFVLSPSKDDQLRNLPCPSTSSGPAHLASLPQHRSTDLRRMWRAALLATLFHESFDALFVSAAGQCFLIVAGRFFGQGRAFVALRGRMGFDAEVEHGETRQDELIECAAENAPGEGRPDGRRFVREGIDHQAQQFVRADLGTEPHGRTQDTAVHRTGPACAVEDRLFAVRPHRRPRQHTEPIEQAVDGGDAVGDVLGLYGAGSPSSKVTAGIPAAVAASRKVSTLAQAVQNRGRAEMTDETRRARGGRDSRVIAAGCCV